MSQSAIETAGTPQQTSADQRRWILLATCLGLLAVMVSVSGLNVAQQALAADIGASQSQLLWIINGFTVALAATLLPLGALGDRVGRKVVLITGLAAFAGLNLASAFAGDPWLLVGLRIAMGISAALIMPTTLSTITAAFPPEERGRAVGVWTGVAGGGGVIGLISSAVLVDYASWQWVFAAPIVIALTALAITIPMVPNTHEQAEGRFDLVGSFISMVAVGGVVLGIHEGPEQGWGAPITVAAFAIGFVALAGFIAWENRQRFPLLDISVFSNRTLSAGALSLTVMFALIIGMFLVMIQFLQAVLGFSAVRSSIALLPMIVGLMMISPVSPTISARLGYRTTMTGALAAAAASLGWMALVPDSPSYLDVLPGLVLLGLALGIAMTPSTTAITESLPADKQGVASALNDTVREVGGAIGVALIGSILAAGYRDGIADTAESLDPELGHTVQEGIGGAYAVAGQLEPGNGAELIGSAQDAFMAGWGNAMWFAAAIALATAIVAFRLIPREPAVPELAPDGEDLSEAPAVEKALATVS
jgi:EmrB/QacA subfamily drug resistance transporter